MNKKVIVITIGFVISIVINLLLLLPYIERKEKILENNKIDRDKIYAIMVQNEDKTGYVESTSDIFPSDMTLNEELTNCVDESGTKVENPFTYENGIITVRTSKKIYCYLYFDIGSSSGGLEILKNPTTGLNTTLEGGLYRYQGTSVENYICFGTSDKDTCLSNTDAHIYRIIGIAEDGRIKLIKNEALESTMQWYSDNTTNITWPNSIIYKNINGSSFLINETYVPSGWEDKIETTIWKYGDNTSSNVSTDELYNLENAWIDINTAKIGLIYMYDYYYAYQSGGFNCSYANGKYDICKTTWIHLNVCDSNAPSVFEWTMSRYGFSDSKFSSWFVAPHGYTNNRILTNTHSIRPVFFLKSNVEFIDGTGKSNDPFIIS